MLNYSHTHTHKPRCFCHIEYKVCDIANITLPKVFFLSDLTLEYIIKERHKNILHRINVIDMHCTFSDKVYKLRRVLHLQVVLRGLLTDIVQDVVYIA